VNIVSAQINTREDGIVIDTFQVNDPMGEPLTGPSQWRKALGALRAVVLGEQPVEELLDRRRAGRRAGGHAGRPKVSIDNRLSDSFTVVEVKCPDRVGLLYLITRTLSGLGLDIASARIATEIDQALDTFYVHDGKGGKVEEPDVMARVVEALEQSLVQPL
jgi:[protein-PII] uridylyltransferase